LRAIPLLQENLSLKILIAGKTEENYLKHLKELCKDLNLTERIYFLDFVENVEDYMWLSDLIVCPGPKEGFGRVVVESMMTSTPVIASRSGAHLEIIKDRQNGLTYKLDDQEELKDKIQELMNNHELYEKIKINSKKTFQSFSLKKHGESVLEIYYSILKLFFCLIEFSLCRKI
jgi:glycosyltransferase involved in cell wall biosynthesis